MYMFQIQIYENGRGGWKLEIVDDEQNITAWDDPFFTDEAALDEAINSFEDDGDETIIDLDRFH